MYNDWSVRCISLIAQIASKAIRYDGKTCYGTCIMHYPSLFPIHSVLTKNDDAMLWKRFLCYWPFVKVKQWSHVDFPKDTKAVYFLCCNLNKLLNDQLNYRWFEKTQRSCDGTVMIFFHVLVGRKSLYTWWVLISLDSKRQPISVANTAAHWNRPQQTLDLQIEPLIDLVIALFTDGRKMPRFAPIRIRSNWSSSMAIEYGF